MRQGMTNERPEPAARYGSERAASASTHPGTVAELFSAIPVAKEHAPAGLIWLVVESSATGLENKYSQASGQRESLSHNAMGLV